MGERHFAQGGSRVSPRPARYLFFASPKKSTQKKGDPAVRDPVLRTGQPAVLAPGRVSLNSRYALKQTRALIRPPLRFSARPQGLWTTESHQPHGPSLRSARVAVQALVDAPVEGCLRGGMRAGARMLR